MTTTENNSSLPAGGTVSISRSPVSSPKKLWPGIILCALAGASYGFQAILAKWAYAEGANSSTILTLRFVIAAVGCWVLVAMFRPKLKITSRKFTGLAILGLIFVGNSGLYYLSLNQLDAGTAALLATTFPGWVVLGAAFFLKEHLDRRRILALALALLGCILTVDPVSWMSGSTKFSWMGAALSLGSALAYAVYILLSGRMVRGVNGLVAAAYSVPFTALVFSIISFSSGQFQWDLSGPGWLYCVGIGLGAMLAVGSYQAGIQMIGPSRASITATSEPATAVLLAILLLGDPANLVKLVGGCLILGAIVILSRPGKR